MSPEETTPVEDDGAGFRSYQRELALVDEILGLRAALAQEGVRNTPSRQKVERLEAEILALRRSTTWRLGRVLMLPARVGKKALRRLGGS